jgi:hypothetical protein
MKQPWNLKYLLITTGISLMVSCGSGQSPPSTELPTENSSLSANIDNQASSDLGNQAVGYNFSYTINTSDIKNATTILFPRGQGSAKLSGSIKIPQVPKDLMSIYLLDKLGNVIAIDMLSKDKTTLNFNSENSAKAYLATSGLMFSWYGDQQNKVYQEVVKHPDFLALVGKIKLLGKIPNSQDFVDLVRKIQTDTGKKIITAGNPKIQSMSIEKNFPIQSFTVARQPDPDLVTVSSNRLLNQDVYKFEGRYLPKSTAELKLLSPEFTLSSPTAFTGSLALDWYINLFNASFQGTIVDPCKDYTLVSSVTTIKDINSASVQNTAYLINSLLYLIFPGSLNYKYTPNQVLAALRHAGGMATIVTYANSIAGEVSQLTPDFGDSNKSHAWNITQSIIAIANTLVSNSFAEDKVAAALDRYAQVGLAAKLTSAKLLLGANIVSNGFLIADYVESYNHESNGDFPYATVAADVKGAYSVIPSDPFDVNGKVPEKKTTAGIAIIKSCQEFEFGVRLSASNSQDVKDLVSVKIPAPTTTIPKTPPNGDSKPFILQVDCRRRLDSSNVQLEIFNARIPTQWWKSSFRAECATPELTGPTFAPDPITAFVGSDATGTLTFGNAGNVNLDWTASASIGTLASLSGTIAPAGTLGGSPANIAYTYPCSSEGTFSATFTVSSNDPVSPSKSVNANVVCKPKLPKIQVSTNYMLMKADVGQLAKGTFTIKNVGNADLWWSVRGGVNMTSPTIPNLSNANYTLKPNESVQIDADSLCNGAGTVKAKWKVFNISINSSDPNASSLSIDVDRSCKGDIGFGGSNYGDNFQAPDGSFTNVFLGGYGCNGTNYSIDKFYVSTKWFANANIENTIYGGNKVHSYETQCILHPSSLAADEVRAQYERWLISAKQDAFNAIKNATQNPNSIVEYTYIGPPTMICDTGASGCVTYVHPVEFHSIVE